MSKRRRTAMLIFQKPLTAAEHPKYGKAAILSIEAYMKEAELARQTAATLAQWKIDPSLDLTTLMADFYTLIDLQHAYPYEQMISLPLKRLTQLLADQFSAYLDMTIGGELRYARGHIVTPDYKGANLDDYKENEITYKYLENMPLTEEGKKIVRNLDGTGLNANKRVPVWSHWHLVRQQQGITALEEAVHIFNTSWSAGYGGESWAKATKVLLDYLKGNMPAVTFVDTCLGLHHNNNVILDKVWNILPEFEDVLNANKSNRMTDVLFHCSIDVKRLRREYRK